jgi:MoaA/NifB/PqqE/SkfB family radical SAM enzyme
MSELVPKLAGHGNKDIILACVVQSDNFRDLPRIVEVAKRWGVAVNFSTYNSLRTGNTDYLVNSDGDLNELEAVVEQLLEMQRNGYSILSSEWTLRQMIRFFRDGYQPNCMAGKRFLIVNPWGKLKCMIRGKNWWRNSPETISATNVTLPYGSIRKKRCVGCLLMPCVFSAKSSRPRIPLKPHGQFR